MSINDHHVSNKSTILLMASSHTVVESVAHSSNEMQELLLSLPTENSSTLHPVSLYNGFWYPLEVLPGIIASRRHFQAQDTDIILATSPKSGTTWLKSLVFAIAKRTQYPISDPNHPLLVTNPHGLVPFLHLLYRDNQLPEISTPPPRLISAHVPYSMLPESVVSSKCPVIYLCRDPKDVFVSMWHFANKFAPQPVPLAVAFNKFCQGLTWFGPCWELALEYWKMSLERPEKVLFLKYEDLKEDITSQVKKIAEHLGCPFSAEEEEEGVVDGIVGMCSFEHLRELEVNKRGEKAVLFVENKDFFRNGRVGDWMNHLTPSMAQQLDKVTQEKLQGSGLTLN